MTAKAYRLLRAIMTTAVEDDKLLPRNPCRIRGAGTEDAAERPVLTVAQVFELAEQVGRRPVGNIRAIPGGYRLGSAAMARCARHRRCTPAGPRPNGRCGRWLVTAAPTAPMTARFYALVLLATSPACAGAR